ncbi:MAG: alpha-L-fucosidase [Planctomycetota bacterium]|nr:alpha-L-fucosidase [Planctomycetota bacterium]
MKELVVSFALIVLMLAGGVVSAGDQPQSNADKFRSMRYGMFIHNVYKLTGAPPGAKYETLDDFANLFDVQAFASQMESIGVEYVFFTAWHFRMYLLGPNAALDKWLPGHTTKRDLVGELADALAAKGISLAIYAHPNDGHDFPAEEQARVGYVKFDKADLKPIPVFNNFINEVYAELAARYRDKPNVLGFWWDSWAENGRRIDIKRLRATVRAQFPEAVILSNNSDAVIDFYCAERNYRQDKDDIDQLNARQVNQTSTFCGGWWRGDAKKPESYKWPGKVPDRMGSLSAETIFRFTVLNAGAGAPGGMCWAASPLADGKTWGSDGEPLETLTKVNGYMKPLRETLACVALSKNWVLPDNATFSQAPAYVATRSLDGTKEYVHVLKPPTGKIVELTKPVEEFRSARLLANGHPVTVKADTGKVFLTLGAEDAWDPLDTVIVLERASQ